MQTNNQPYIISQDWGFYADQNYDKIPINCMVDAININHQEGGRKPRGGCEVLNSTPITSSPTIKGIYQFKLESGTTHIITGCSNGTVYSDYTTQIASGLGTDKKYRFETFYNNLYICNGNNTPMKWTGSGSAAALTNIPLDWTGTNQPKFMIKHGARARKSLWAAGVASHPNRIYVSDSGTDDFSDSITIDILDVVITGMVEFGGRILVFSRDKTYIIDDVSLDVADWGYQAAIWEGGAACQELIVKTPTDVVVMSETAEVFSVTASEQYGDYQIASLTRPAFLHQWIEKNIDLTQIESFHACYDMELRCIKFFMIPFGGSSPSIGLVYFIDMGAQAGWTKHEYLVNQTCSTLVRVSASDWKIYTGGTIGQAYSLESSTLRDAGEIYRASWLTPPFSLGNQRSEKRFDKFWITNMPRGFETIKLNVYVDDRTLTGGFDFIDENDDYISDENNNTLYSEPTDPFEIVMEGLTDILKNYGDDLGSIGQRTQFEVYNDLGENFFVSDIIIDALDLGNHYDNYY